MSTPNKAASKLIAIDSDSNVFLGGMNSTDRVAYEQASVVASTQINKTPLASGVKKSEILRIGANNHNLFRIENGEPIEGGDLDSDVNDYGYSMRSLQRVGGVSEGIGVAVNLQAMNNTDAKQHESGSSGDYRDAGGVTGRNSKDGG